ncbi:MAG: hypothetical protein AAGC60_07020 [Acidobacteriota bacterium]
MSETHPLDAASARQVFEELHAPVYEVYDVGLDGDTLDRDALYRHLAARFEGELLTREYVEHLTTIARMQADEASMRVLRVDYEEVDLLAADGDRLRLLADWSVGGIVRHRDHRHVRTNRYRAVYELARRGDGWRIVDTRLRDMRRLRGAVEGLADERNDDEAPRSRRGMLSPLELLRAGMGEELAADAEAPEDAVAPTDDTDESSP